MSILKSDSIHVPLFWVSKKILGKPWKTFRYWTLTNRGIGVRMSTGRARGSRAPKPKSRKSMSLRSVWCTCITNSYGFLNVNIYILDIYIYTNIYIYIYTQLSHCVHYACLICVYHTIYLVYYRHHEDIISCVHACNICVIHCAYIYIYFIYIYMYICISYLIILYIKWCGYISYRQNLAHGKGTSLCRVGNLPQGIALSIVLGWAPIGFAVSDTHMFYVIYHMYWNSSLPICLSVSGHMHVGICDVGITLPSTRHTASILQEKRGLWLVQDCSYVYNLCM